MSEMIERLKRLAFGKWVEADHYSFHDIETFLERASIHLPAEYLEFLREWPSTGSFDELVDCHGVEAGPWAPDQHYLSGASP
jgi:hypothetical protein